MLFVCEVMMCPDILLCSWPSRHSHLCLVSGICWYLSGLETQLQLWWCWLEPEYSLLSHAPCLNSWPPAYEVDLYHTFILLSYRPRWNHDLHWQANIIHVSSLTQINCLCTSFWLTGDKSRVQIHMTQQLKQQTWEGQILGSLEEKS